MRYLNEVVPFRVLRLTIAVLIHARHPLRR